MGCGGSSSVKATTVTEPEILNYSGGQYKAIRLPAKQKLDRVTKLNLSKNLLTSLPEDFDSLTRLESLDLSFNTQLNELPSSIANCPLTSLNISNCGFTEFPEALLSLHALRHLDVSGQPQLSLPTGLKELKQLESIRLMGMGFYFWPAQLNGLPLVALHIGGRPGHPIRLNRSFPKLSPHLVELVLEHVDFRGGCCYRERKGSEAGAGLASGSDPEAIAAAAAAAPAGAGHALLVARSVGGEAPPAKTAQSTSALDNDMAPGAGRESSAEAKTLPGEVENGHVAGSSEAPPPRLHIELDAAAGTPGENVPTSPVAESPGQLQNGPPSRRPSVGVGRSTGGGLSTLLPTSLVHMMVNRRPGSGNERAHKTADLPDNLLALANLQRLTMRHMHLRSLGGISRLQRLSELDVQFNNIRYLTPELAELEELKSCRLGNNYTTDFFIERGYPHQARDVLQKIDVIPPGVQGLATIDDLFDYVTREVVVRQPTHTHVTYETAPGEAPEESDDSDVEAEVEHELQRLVASQSSRIRSQPRSGSVSLAAGLGGGGGAGAGSGSPLATMASSSALGAERGSGASDASALLHETKSLSIPGEVPPGSGRRLAAGSSVGGTAGHSRTSSTGSAAGLTALAVPGAAASSGPPSARAPLVVSPPPQRSSLTAGSGSPGTASITGSGAGVPPASLSPTGPALATTPKFS